MQGRQQGQKSPQNRQFSPLPHFLQIAREDTLTFPNFCPPALPSYLIVLLEFMFQKGTHQPQKQGHESEELENAPIATEPLGQYRQYPHVAIEPEPPDDAQRPPNPLAHRQSNHVSVVNLGGICPTSCSHFPTGNCNNWNKQKSCHGSCILSKRCEMHGQGQFIIMSDVGRGGNMRVMAVLGDRCSSWKEFWIRSSYPEIGREDDVR